MFSLLSLNPSCSSLSKLQSFSSHILILPDWSSCKTWPWKLDYQQNYELKNLFFWTTKCSTPTVNKIGPSKRAFPSGTLCTSAGVNSTFRACSLEDPVRAPHLLPEKTIWRWFPGFIENRRRLHKAAWNLCTDNILFLGYAASFWSPNITCPK